eukprot:2246368-Lingulodinium_polyedra.AAC.1
MVPGARASPGSPLCVARAPRFPAPIASAVLLACCLVWRRSIPPTGASSAGPSSHSEKIPPVTAGRS